MFSFGVRVPYSRPLERDPRLPARRAEPYLRLFRRLPLRIGPLDLTPLVALLVLQIVGGIIVGLIRP